MQSTEYGDQNIYLDVDDSRLPCHATSSSLKNSPATSAWAPFVSFANALHVDNETEVDAEHGPSLFLPSTARSTYFASLHFVYQ